jgi:NitT/TauT family transport system substrate-binding protein
MGKNVGVKYLLILSIFVLSSCASPQASPTATIPAAHITVQLSWLHQAQFSGFYAAVDQGYYKDENLNVELLAGGIGPNGYINPMDQVISNKADFGMASTNEILRAQAANQSLVAIASTLQRSPRSFISLAAKNISKPQDLVGKRVAFRPDDNSVYLALLKVANVNRTDINEITDATKFTLDALINDQIDVIPAFIDNEPLILKKKGHEVNAILASDYGIETYENLIFTRKDLIDKNSDQVLRFLRATLRGYTYAIQNPDKTAALGLNYDATLDLETQKAQLARLIPLINIPNSHPGLMQENVWNKAYQVLTDQGILTKPLKVADTYDLSFVQQIYKGQ